jgi:hypothetical protein
VPLTVSRFSSWSGYDSMRPYMDTAN